MKKRSGIKFKLEEYNGDEDKWYPIELSYEDIEECYVSSIHYEYFIHTDQFGHRFFCRMNDYIKEGLTEYNKYCRFINNLRIEKHKKGE